MAFRWALLVVLLFSFGFALIGQNAMRSPDVVLTASPTAAAIDVREFPQAGAAPAPDLLQQIEHEQRRAVVVDRRFVRSMERLEARLRVGPK